jgi:predicted RNase H-like nuclease (RuvC/YqgF family)
MINKLEDELKDKSKKVDKLKGDVEAMERISKE